MKKRNAKELFLMTGCPHCGAEVNREFIENLIDEIVKDAVAELERDNEVLRRLLPDYSEKDE